MVSACCLLVEYCSNHDARHHVRCFNVVCILSLKRDDMLALLTCLIIPLWATVSVLSMCPLYSLYVSIHFKIFQDDLWHISLILLVYMIGYLGFTEQCPSVKFCVTTWIVLWHCILCCSSSVRSNSG